MSDPTVVRHVSKDHVVIAPAPGWEVTVFKMRAGAFEAIVAAKDGSETIRLLIDPPSVRQQLQIERVGDNVHVRYSDVG